LISGVLSLQKGEILIDGKSVSREDSRKELFFLPDDPYFTIYTTGESLYKMYAVFYPQIDYGVFNRFMESFSLDMKKPIRNFSKGMRRQLYISLALAVRPKYLLLDEAFDGLDPLSRLSVKRAINDFVEENGTSVIVSSHSLREMEDFCDSYVLLDNKTVSSSGDIAEKVGGYCSFMLAFTVPVEEGVFDGLPLVKAYKNGKFIKATFEGNADEIEEKLRTHSPISPAVIERMTVDFEEVFINEVSRKESV
jgi:ABC-2 type transport system ATP-binding protein